MSKELDLSCFSYLASARVLQIEQYPQLNGGAEISGVIDTLAADAPMAAITASRLGLKVGLITNPLGNDEQGRTISHNLQENNITNQIETKEGIKTPFIMVLSDNSGNREWLAYTKEAQEGLMETDLSQMKKQSSLVYIDLYAGIKEASLRAIDYASENNLPVFLNLSGDVPTEELTERLTNKNIAIVQVGLHESREGEAEKVATEIYQKLTPKISIVTLASKGAIAVSGKTTVKTEAYLVDVLHVHGAGAVFSGGFAYGYLQGRDLQRNIEFACALGSLSCTKERGFEQFTMEEVEQLMATKNK